MEKKFVGVTKVIEPRRILHDCYPGTWDELCRISERFIWPGTVKDVNDTVRHAT